jgi:hypothetical protein
VFESTVFETLYDSNGFFAIAGLKHFAFLSLLFGLDGQLRNQLIQEFHLPPRRTLPDFGTGECRVSLPNKNA